MKRIIFSAISLLVSAYGMASVQADRQPYTLPFVESFTNGAETYEWSVNEGANSDDYGLLTDIEGRQSSDGDNGWFGFRASTAGEELILTSGKIALNGAANPVLSFHRYYKARTDITLIAEAVKPDGSIVRLKTYDYNYGLATSPARWAIDNIPLNSLANEQYIQIRFHYKANTTGILNGIDDIQLRDVKANDISINVSASRKVVKGQKININVTLSNLYDDQISGYTLKVKAGNNIIADETSGQALTPMSKLTKTYTYQTTSLYSGDSLPITAEVSLDGDADVSNNTAQATTALENTWRNAPQNLTLTTGGSGEGTHLSWDEPAKNANTVTEDFESYEPWSLTFGDWTLIDGDKASTGGVFEYSDFPHVGEPMAFIIMNPSLLGETLAAHSGNQFAAAPYAFYDATTETYYPQADNWMISPELSGNRQTITFWVSNLRGHDYNGNLQDNTETFYLMGSKTGKDRADFTDYYGPGIRNRYEIYYGQWTQFSATLDEGTKYFAFHDTSASDDIDGGPILLMFDDITYEAGGAPTSYNIYRNGNLIGNSTVISYDDAAEGGSASAYDVTAVYADGSESAPASIIPAGIKSVTGNTGVKDTPAYNLAGQQVDKEYKGIVIRNGKKTIRR